MFQIFNTAAQAFMPGSVYAIAIPRYVAVLINLMLFNEAMDDHKDRHYDYIPYHQHLEAMDDH